MPDGDEELQQHLDALPRKVRAALAAKIAEQADQLAAAIRAEAPHAAEHDTGKLSESVRVEAGRHELEKVVAAGGNLTTRNNYDYALAVEFGTSHQAAEPFFWPTYRRRRDAIREAIAAAVDEALEG